LLGWGRRQRPTAGRGGGGVRMDPFDKALGNSRAEARDCARIRIPVADAGARPPCGGSPRDRTVACADSTSARNFMQRMKNECSWRDATLRVAADSHARFKHWLR